MSDNSSTADKPKTKKRNKLRVLLFAAVGLLVVGGSVGGTLYFVGGMPSGPEAEAPDVPKLMARDDASSHQIEVATLAARRGRIDPHVFKATYVPMTDQFTSNLRGGGAYVQMGLALLTYYDEKVAANVETHKLAIRSAVLMTLAEQDPNEITTSAGKDRLRAELKRRINETLEAREGFGGIESVYFTNLLIQ